MIDDDGRLRCCNKKFGNCPTVVPTSGGFSIVGDDGQSVEFSIEQFEILIDEGPALLEAIGL